jgi:hypothetical protein
MPKIFILALSLSSFSFILESIKSSNPANAQGSLGQTIQQFNNNLRTGIDKQIQSILTKVHNNLQLMLIALIAIVTTILLLYLRQLSMTK